MMLTFSWAELKLDNLVRHISAFILYIHSWVNVPSILMNMIGCFLPHVQIPEKG